MSRHEPPRIEIDIETATPEPAGPRTQRHRARLLAAMVGVLAAFVCGYAVRGTADDPAATADAFAAAVTAVPDLTPIHLPPNAGADGAVYFGVYPRRLEPSYCDASP